MTARKDNLPKRPAACVTTPARLDEIRLCNCTRCGRELLGGDNDQVLAARALLGPMHSPPRPGGYVLGRAYCPTCWRKTGRLRSTPIDDKRTVGR